MPIDRAPPDRNEAPVAPFMRVVANGVRNGTLHATLIVTPQKAAGGDLQLADWPSAIARRFNPHGGADGITFPLRVCFKDPTKGGCCEGDANGASSSKTVAARFRAAPVANAEVLALWRRAIEGDGSLPTPWTALLDDIDRSMSGDKQTGDFTQAKYSGDKDLPDTNYFDNAGAMVASPHDPRQSTTVTGVVANTQTQYAIEIEAARAQRVATKLRTGPYLPGDQDDEANSETKVAAAESGWREGRSVDAVPADGPDSLKGRLTEARRQMLFDRLKSSVDMTDPARGKSFDTYKAVSAYLDAGVAKGGVPPAAVPPPSVVAPREQVLGGSTTSDRASHIYGAWTQRSPGASPGVAQGCPASLARVHGVYYSFQGDPILSRFFGLAFDLEFASDYDIESSSAVWLAPDLPGGAEQVWTKAVYHQSASGEHFWPASRFDGDAPSGAGFAVEQNHGVFNLGLSCESQKPDDGFRYDLTSLDVRGAVSSARDALDLGHRHRTIGWTLLDRCRADQTARDLAINDRQNKERKANKPLVLYAEELTIGRRLDVAATREGAQVASLVWRSLMNRFVDFTSLKAEGRQHLNRVVADRRRDGLILDESSFQLMARSMPLVGKSGDGQKVEAVVEEAIQTWDGTPLAALACKQDAPAERGQCVPQPVLPIKRTYDLPSAKHSVLRPPPLRYGVGYIFSIRAVFLGGGSPSVEEAGKLHREKQGVWTLPPSPDGQARPRRYLRHEGIDAPSLMLPRTLIDKLHGKDGVMGFEAPGQAIVRSHVVPSSGAPKPVCAAPMPPAGAPGPDYVKAIDRAAPNETLRVFVAPMVGFDFASRHRVFDDPKTADLAIRGGLLDVDFTDPDRKEPRFPVAIVKRNTGFNGERLVYRREFGWPRAIENRDGDTDGLGATVFSPKAAAKREPARGYLPDPAAQTMSFRLRVSGADNYLEGDISVDLYADKENVKYPNALPVVVTIGKRGPRKDFAAKIADVMIDRKAIFRLDGAGKVRPDSSGVGVRVRYLKILLAPGEQFDLEATCLPTPKKLGAWFSLPETIGVQHVAAQSDESIMAAMKTCCGELPLLAELNTAASQPAPRAGLNGSPPPDDNGLEAIANKLVHCIRNDWPLTELASPTKLRVIHAVNLPEKAPTLKAVKVLRPARSTGASPKPDPAPGHAGPADPPTCDATPPKGCSKALAQTDCPTNPDYVDGSTSFLLSGEILVDLEQCDAVDIVATVANASGKPFDDPTRARGILAKRTGQWPRTTSADGTKRLPVPSASVFGFDVEADGKTRLVPETITLLRIQNLPDPRAAINGEEDKPRPFTPGQGRLTALDLRVLHLAAITGATVEVPVALPMGALGQSKQQPRKLSVTRPHELNDTKARALQLEVVGFSRFTAAFETAPRFSKDGEEHVLHRRQPLQPQDQSSRASPIIVWSPSTERPAACGTRTPTPFFSIKRSAKRSENGVAQLLDREAGVRLRFDRGMFSSGEGERIAIVLWPPNIRDQSVTDLDQNWIKLDGRWMQLSNFDDSDLGDGGKFVSRWGGDPIRSDPQPQKSFFMPWSAFSFFDKDDADGKQPHDPVYVPRACMPVCAASNADGKDSNGSAGTEGRLEVSLLTFEPYFDVEREEWFVDVPMKLARATDPFIRFGLVRYQPNAICEDLKVSTPTRVWTQLPSHRHVSVTHEKIGTADIAVNVHVRGQASDGIKPLPDDLKYLLDDPKDPKAPKPREIWQRLQRPKMTLRLIHEGAPTSFGRHQTDVLGGETYSALPNPIDGDMVWTLKATIPAQRIENLGNGRIFAVVEETEERLAASFMKEPIDLASVLTSDSIRESGPRFMARIPFLDV